MLIDPGHPAEMPELGDSRNLTYKNYRQSEFSHRSFAYRSLVKEGWQVLRSGAFPNKKHDPVTVFYSFRAVVFSLSWEESMKKILGFLLIGTVLSSSIAFAEDRAVNISISSKGVPADASAIQKVRKITAQALAQGTVDTFYVYNPRVDGPHFIEGGLFACAEAGFNSTPQKFQAFIEQLRSVHPKRLIVYKVEQAASCKAIEPTEPQRCGGFAGRKCSEEQQYCDFGSTGQCGVADGQGVCKTKPEFCPEIFKPVCGCDGKTYGNACEAARAGASVKHEGKCGDDQ